MRNLSNQKYGAPLTQMASRVLLALLLAALCGQLRAESPESESGNWLGKAQTALTDGDSSALANAVRALKSNPLGADENRLMSLTMFWAGHFDDSARYMRRALAADVNALESRPVLADSMPGDAVVIRLNALANQAGADDDLCFLTGTLLLLNGDRPRALAFLVRAGELAGTDGQAEQLIGDDERRNPVRARAAMAKGDYADAVRSFTFAALDSPTVAEYYAGLALSLAAASDTATGVGIAEMVYARYRFESLFSWLQQLEAHDADLAVVAANIEQSDAPGLSDLKLAMMLYMASGYWLSARDVGIKGLLLDKLETFIHDANIWMDENNLHGNPDGAIQPGDPPGDAGGGAKEDTDETADTPTLETARNHIRQSEFTEALKVLDAFVTDDAEPEVYHLVFVALVGRSELTDASAALQLWFKSADDDQRMKLNALRELFATKEQFEQWRAKITDIRDADPNVGLPRLLNAYVEVTRGRYNSARDELVVPRIEMPNNAMVVALTNLLGKKQYQRDTTPDGIPNDLKPKALFGRAEQRFRDGEYEQAKSAYLEALEADPDLPFVSAGLFRCYFALGDYDNAYKQILAMLDEQTITEDGAAKFSLLLDAGYKDDARLADHLAALKDACDERKLSFKPWFVYGLALLDRKDYEPAVAALQTWHDNVRGEHDPLLVQFLELAKQRAS